MKSNAALILLSSMILLCNCHKEKETTSLPPTRVKVEELNMSNQSMGQTYVGIVEEREATSRKFHQHGGDSQDAHP